MSETESTKPRRSYRRRASHFQRCRRCYFIHQGRTIRLLEYTDYRPIYSGGREREFVKRITHRRWAKGLKMAYGEMSEWAHVLANLPPGQWFEIVPVEDMNAESVKEVA